MQDLNESGWSIVNANSNNRQSFFLSKLKIAVTKVVDMSISNKVLIDLSAVTPAEADHGHRCTYTLDTLERDVVAAGLKVTHRSGIFFKALANFQWDRLLQTDIVSKEYLEGCYQLGQIYPDLCSSIFLMCERN